MIITNKNIKEVYENSLIERGLRCKVEGDCIILHQATIDYDIKLDRCSTYKDITHWVAHLCQKNWIDTMTIEEFVKVACSHHGLDVYNHSL